MAVRHHHQAADLVLRRSARRQPGADRADGRRAQAAHVRDAVPAWASRRSRSAFPSASQTDFDFVRQLIEQEPHPRRRHHPGADAGAAGADRAHLRERWTARSAPSCISTTRPRPCSAAWCSAWTCRASSTSPSTAPSWCAKLADANPSTDWRVPVFAGELHRHRARIRARGLRGGDGCLEADAARTR